MHRTEEKQHEYVLWFCRRRRVCVLRPGSQQRIMLHLDCARFGGLARVDVEPEVADSVTKKSKGQSRMAVVGKEARGGYVLYADKN